MKRHLRFMASLGLGLLFATLISAQDPPKGRGKPNYYPMQVGNEWHYRFSIGGNESQLMTTIAKIETIDKMPLALLEGYMKDKLIATEHLLQTEEGIYRYRNNGQVVTPPLMLMKYPVKYGAKWGGDLVVGKEKATYVAEANEETVEVPAGKFKTVRVDIKLDQGGQAAKVSYWFSQNVGFVKQTVEAGPVNITMELEKHVLKKADKGDKADKTDAK